MASGERGYSVRSEMRVYQSIFDNALYDLNSGSYLTNGRLCEDIASLGYAQSVAVETVFDSQPEDIKRRLAARVCESCVSWLKCGEKLYTSIPMDEANPFMIYERDRMPPDYGPISSVKSVR